MFKLTGFRKSEGEFNGHQYSNYVYDFIHNENDLYVGYSTSYKGMTHLTIPTKKLHDIAGVDSPEKLVNKNVKPVWDFGFEGKAKLVRLEILPDNK